MYYILQLHLNLSCYISTSVVKSHHKFMLASYMMQIAKFLAILHHNASFYNFCFIINLFHCLIFSKY